MVETAILETEIVEGVQFSSLEYVHGSKWLRNRENDGNKTKKLRCQGSIWNHYEI